jgi:UDP-N-acetylmuramoyl-L-alanyl-D-glutamate--2,6-diaminopimelate ligase
MKNFLRKLAPDFLLNWYHFGWALLGAIIYRFPSKRLKVIGITGTNGKSTVVFLISQILEKAGYQVASLSSIQFKIEDKIWPNTLKMTMPGRLKMQKFLRQAVQTSCQYAVLEVTSEGIKQHRHQFIDFETAILTNLTAEHLESHGGFDNYRRAKGKLFQKIGPQGKIIVNLDDPSADYFLQFKADEKYGYVMDQKGVVDAPKIIQASNCRISQKGIGFSIEGVDFNLNLLGKFNIANALAAITFGLAEEIPLTKIKLALEKIKGLPGRLETVIKEPYMVIVDYAHTPDALEKVYQTIREVFPGRLIGLLGAAGGGRDKWKRPQLGRIAEKYLDKIVITNEDPYDEDPQAIIDQVAAGLEQKQAQKILDRRQAIRQALKIARTGDVVIITGKGCEPWLCVANGKKISWDDRQAVREEFTKLSFRVQPKPFLKDAAAGI